MEWPMRIDFNFNHTDGTVTVSRKFFGLLWVRIASFPYEDFREISEYLSKCKEVGDRINVIGD